MFLLRGGNNPNRVANVRTTNVEIDSLGNSEQQPPLFSTVLSTPTPQVANENRFDSVEEVYVPLKVAKKKIGEVQADMEAMKAEHLEIIKELERHYKEMEKDMQEYFLDYIAKLKRATEIREKQHLREIATIKAGTTVFTELGEKTILEANDTIETLKENIAILESELKDMTKHRDLLQQQLSVSSQLCHSLIQDLREQQDTTDEVGSAFNLMMQQCKDLINRLDEQNMSNTELKSALQSDHADQLQSNRAFLHDVDNLDAITNAIRNCLNRLEQECLVKLELLNKYEMEKFDSSQATVKAAELVIYLEETAVAVTKDLVQLEEQTLGKLTLLKQLEVDHNDSVSFDKSAAEWMTSIESTMSDFTMIFASTDDQVRMQTEKLFKTQSQLDDLTEANRSLNASVIKLENEIATLTSNLSSTDQVLKTEINKLEKILEELDSDYFEKFNGMELDMSTFEKIITNLAAHTNPKIVELEALLAKKEVLESENSNLVAERGNLLSLVETLKSEQATLQTERESLLAANSQSASEISDSQNQLEKLLQEKKAAEEEISQLQEENLKANTEKDSFSNQVQELQNQVQRLTVGSADLSEEQEKLQSEVNRLHEKLSLLQIECDTQRAELLHLKDIEANLKESESRIKAVQAAAVIVTKELLSTVALCVDDSAGLGQDIGTLVEEAAMNAMPQDSAQYVKQQVRVLARASDRPGAASAAQVLVKQQARLEVEQRQFADALEKIAEEKENIHERLESASELNEDERAEFVRIRRREYEEMEKKLIEKQKEIQEHLSTNQALQEAMLVTSQGDSLAAEEAHIMIERHALEIEDLRIANDQKVARLEADLAEARAAVSADKESLQDQIFELEDRIKEEAAKMLAILGENEELHRAVQVLKDENIENSRILRDKILELEMEICDYQIKTAALEAKYAIDAQEKAETNKASLEDQVDLARKALTEAENKDKQEAKGKGEGAKVVRSEAAKAAYWNLDRLTKEVEAKTKEIADITDRLDTLKQNERSIAEEAQARKEEQRLAWEKETAERREALEAELARREEQARLRIEEQTRLQQIVEPTVAPPSSSVDKILADIKSDVRRSSMASVSSAVSATDSDARIDKAAAKAKAQVELKKETEKAGPEALAQRKAVADANKKIKQLEASNSKLQQKVDSLEVELSNAKAARAAVHPADKKGDKKSGASADGGKKRDDNLAQNLEKAKKDLAESEKELKKLQASHETTVKELDTASKQLDAVKKKCSDLDEQVKTLTLNVTDLDEKLQKERKLRKKYLQELEDLKGKIRVYARCRPFAAYEKERRCKQCVRFIDDTTCEVDVGKKGKKEFVFDEVFAPDSRQEQIFEGVVHLVQSAVDGFNVCIFAYGQTGSGKTFTMYGKRDDPNLWGIAPRAMKEVYDIIERDSGSYDITVTCYMLELYNDQLIDLLADKKKGETPPPLSIKLDPRGVVVVQNAVIRGPCTSFEQLQRWNEYGINQRHVASTAMNAESSRSHLLFSIIIESKNKQTGNCTIGKMTLVDLAGSERQSKTQAQGDRIKEAISINKSLSALGDVISALSTGEKIIPYRNNKLTHVLQDGLGGNAKTLMFVNISPADYNCDETASSLQYAIRVKNITNNASKQVESAEIQRLKKIIADLQSGKKVAALEPAEEAEDPAGNLADQADDSKYLHGTDQDRDDGEGGGGEEEPEQGEGESGQAAQASGSELVQASGSALVPAFDEEDPDEH